MYLTILLWCSASEGNASRLRRRMESGEGMRRTLPTVSAAAPNPRYRGLAGSAGAPPHVARMAGKSLAGENLPARVALPPVLIEGLRDIQIHRFWVTVITELPAIRRSRGVGEREVGRVSRPGRRRPLPGPWSGRRRRTSRASSTCRPRDGRSRGVCVRRRRSRRTALCR